MLLKCPACAAQFSAEAAVDHNAGKDLMGLLAGMDGELARPLLAYIGLFRPRKSALSWDRSLRLSREVLALQADPAVLATALHEVVLAMHTKQDGGAWTPLANHNYLARVLETTSARSAVNCVTPPPTTRPLNPESQAPRSKSGQALVSLERMKRDD